MVYRKLGCFCKGLRKRLRVTRRTNKQVALWSESRVNWIDARSDFQRRSSVERKVGVSWASFFKGWSVQCRAEGRDEAPSPWNSELRWPLWERILCRGNVFTNWSTTGPGEGSQESEQVVSRARLPTACEKNRFGWICDGGSSFLGFGPGILPALHPRAGKFTPSSWTFLETNSYVSLEIFEFILSYIRHMIFSCESLLLYRAFQKVGDKYRQNERSLNKHGP